MSGSLPVDLVAADPAYAAHLLRSTDTIRERAQALLQRARAGQSAHWLVDDTRLPAVAQQVADVTRQRYPDLTIPFHSRWRHFEPGGHDRLAWLGLRPVPSSTPQALAWQARTRFDLAVVSVLLDAGAGPSWRYREERTGMVLGRSEGLGVASLHAFASGLFSSDPADRLRADAQGLGAVSVEALAQAFQVSGDNPLVGLEGRVDLLRRLGYAMAAQTEVFGPDGRPGGLFDHLLASSPSAGGTRSEVDAHDVLLALLNTLSAIWPSGQWLGDVPLGDCWPLAAARGPGSSDGWMPFHKLSQWLTYSLLEPLMDAGNTVVGLDRLTGLPEYRNGGLFIDHGVLKLRQALPPDQLLLPQDERVVEWRALTVALLDELAPLVRALLGRTPEQMPLACVLEGGTWAAGRLMAQTLRGGQPPLNIASDGTVF